MQFVTTTTNHQLSTADGNVARLTYNTMDQAQRGNGVRPSNEGAKSTTKKSLRKKSVIHRSNTFDDSLLSFREVDSAKRQLKYQLQWLSKVVACLGVLSVALAIVYIELNARFGSNWSAKSLKEPARLAELLVASLLSMVSLATCIFIQRLQSAELRLLVVKNIYHKSETLWSTSLFPCCIVENLICLFHVPPLCNEYGVPYKLQLLVFLRMYLLTRYVKEHSRFTNNKSTAFFASVTKTEITSTFLVKAYFLKYPFQLIAIVYSLNVFLGGYFVYVVEGTLSYMDTIWMLVVTMTTLGFGDVVPVSFVARAFVGFSSILGIFLMALFISVVHETLQLRQLEKRIISTTESAETLTDKKSAAAACIQSAWRLHNYTIKNLEMLEVGSWIKAIRWRYLHHRMLHRQRQWRLARRASSSDEYWKKLFLAEDTAMMLTDVYRTVNSIEQRIPRLPHTGRCRALSRRASFSSTIKEETEGSPELKDSMPSIRDSNRRLYTAMPEPRKVQSDQDLDNSKSPTNKRPTNVAVSTGNQSNHGPEPIRLRAASEPISPDALERKIESFERSLDDVFRKVRSELRDMKDSIKMLKNRSFSASQGIASGSLDLNYPTNRGLGNVDV